MGLKFLRDEEYTLPEKSGNLATLMADENCHLLLEWKDGQYWLHSDVPQEKPIGIRLDEELERHLAFFKKSSLKDELLARAMGLKGSYRPRVMDLTAGLLGDSLLMLAMGCQVWAYERHPIVAFLIQSALDNACHPLLKNFKFAAMDAIKALENPPEVDVIYYDPMFEDANHKSLPRKEMRIFREVVGEDSDSKEVFARALGLRARRLVVKRPRLSAPLIIGEPLSYKGKSTRYDVYLSQNHGPNESNHLK